jgi:hypothetical protein
MLPDFPNHVIGFPSTDVGFRMVMYEGKETGSVINLFTTIFGTILFVILTRGAHGALAERFL